MERSTARTVDNTEQEYDRFLIDIVHYVYHVQIDSPKAWQRARIALLDSLGCVMESLATSPECAKLIGPVVSGTVVPGGSRIPGTSYVVDPVKGAFDIGTLIRYLDHNDAYPGAEWGHPSDNLGSIIAVADYLARSAYHYDRHPPLTLRTLLEAQIKAYEIQGSIQQLNSFNAMALDHVILVKVASVSVVSWLLGLSETSALAALSQVWQDGVPLRTYRQAPNTSSRKGWAAGDACMRAVHLALLTQSGQAGSPTVLTTPKWGFYSALFGGKEFLLSRPYSSHIMETLFFKLIPAEGHGISAIEAALQITEHMKQSNLSAERDIAAIIIRTQKPGFTIINKTGTLHNAADRDHCLQYMVAVALLKQAVIETSDYDDDSPWSSNPQVDALRSKMTVTEDPEFTRGYYDPKIRSGANGITVQFNNGAVLQAVVEYPIGHPSKSETLEQVRNKFRKNLGLKFSTKRVAEMELAVEKDELQIDQFMDLFVIS